MDPMKVWFIINQTLRSRSQPDMLFGEFHRFYKRVIEQWDHFDAADERPLAAQLSEGPLTLEDM